MDMEFWFIQMYVSFSTQYPTYKERNEELCITLTIRLWYASFYESEQEICDGDEYIVTESCFIHWPKHK